jgi:hypothetical protein
MVQDTVQKRGLPLGRVEGERHQATTDQASNGDGHDPGEEQQTDTLPVDGLEGAVAETDAHGCAGDAHGGGHRQLVLREDEDGDGCAELHGGSTGRRVVGELVTHNCGIVSL